jgi:hypothetical protein
MSGNLTGIVASQLTGALLDAFGDWKVIFLLGAGHLVLSVVFWATLVNHKHKI